MEGVIGQKTKPRTVDLTFGQWVGFRIMLLVVPHQLADKSI